MNIQNEQLTKISKQVAIISFIFVAALSLLMVLNYVRLKSVDPVQTEKFDKLIQKLNQTPGDEELKQQIRTVDLAARKAFFTTKWQLNFGGFMLIISMIIFFISYKLYLSATAKIQTIDSQSKQVSYWNTLSKERLWLGSGVSIITLSAIILFFVSGPEYSDFNESSAIAKNNSDTTKQKSIQKSEIKTVSTDSTLQKTQDTLKIAENDFPSDAEINSNYPSFRGPFGLGICYQTDIPTEWDATTGKNIIWKTAVPLQGLNSPILWGNYLFIAGGNATTREVYCYNRLTGKMVWSKKVDNIKDSPAKAPKVSDDTGYSASTMTTDGKRVFAIFATGDVICFDFKGERIWAKNIGVPENHYGHSSSLVMFQNLLIIQFDHSKSRSLIALSASTGEEKWKSTRAGRISWSSPIVVKSGASAQIIMANDPYVSAHDALSGKELWKVDCLTGEIGPSPAYSNGTVVAANAYATMTAIKTSGAKIWEANDFLPDASSPVAWKDMIFVATSAGEVACQSISDGSVIWSHEFDNGFYGSPIIAEGKVYLLDRNGIMHVIKAEKTFTLVAESKLGEKSDCTPAFAKGRIYLRGKNNLYCIGVK